MYETIYVPVDNSAHSNRAVDCALQLGGSFQSKLVGCHVYAAQMHDYRFKQMEFTLPEEYLVESELARQRKIHDSLITMGLQLISDCYLEDIDRRAQEVGLECERKMMDGKHSTEIIRDIHQSDYDLVVMGALGIGRTKDSQIGAVAARVTRETTEDTWVVRHVPDKDEAERDTVLVGVDGSPQSFGALMTAIELAKRFDKKLEVVGVYDPYLHYAVFKGIVEVLTDKAAKVFRFEEQNQLHEEIIDTGLAEIYQSHLNVAATMAREHGVQVEKTLLDGKAYQKILDHARKVEPWVLVLGHIGVHAGEEENGLGSNTEMLLRLAPCDLLLTSREVVPELDLKAEESIHWTPEAEERMTRVPDQVKGIARTAILRLALEHGHSVVSSDLVTEAMERFMPKASGAATEKLAEALAFEKARKEQVSVCTGCGMAARIPDPQRCTVCGGESFEAVTPEVLEAIAEAEGGVTEETTYDGRKLAWSREARAALRAIEDRYQRRRAKARIEKAARGQKMDPITLEFARRFVEEETGVLYKPAANAAETLEQAREMAEENGHDGNGAPAEASVAADDPEIQIIARDAKNNPLVSRYDWTENAIERILRVPAGFMRDRTQGRVEELAAERTVDSIDLQLVEDGIEHGRVMMAEMLGQVTTEPAQPEPQPEPPAQEAQQSEQAQEAMDEAQAAGKCPFDHEGAAQEGAAHEAAAHGEAAHGEAQAAGKCPVDHESHDAETLRALAEGKGAEDLPKMALNEVSVMTEVEKRRREMEAE